MFYNSPVSLKPLGILSVSVDLGERLDSAFLSWLLDRLRSLKAKRARSHNLQQQAP